MSRGSLFFFAIAPNFKENVCFDAWRENVTAIVAPSWHDLPQPARLGECGGAPVARAYNAAPRPAPPARPGIMLNFMHAKALCAFAEFSVDFLLS